MVNRYLPIPALVDRLTPDAGASPGAAALTSLLPSRQYCRTICIAVKQLAALDAGLQDSVIDAAAVWLVTAACKLISICARTCGDVGVPASQPHILATVQLVLHHGAAAQLHAAQDRTSIGLLHDTVAAQAWALDAWQVLSMASSVKGCAPPELLLQWLQQTLKSVRLLEPPSWKPGGRVGKLLGPVSGAAEPAWQHGTVEY